MTRKATFGAGCFWGVEAAFRQLGGVTRTRVGYSGGDFEDPTYGDVCSGNTGHTEVVEVTYDPEQLPYERLLEVFWAKHNPTRRKGNGVRIADQYRSVVFVHDETQRDAALRSKACEERKWLEPVVTQIESAQTFYEAEERHQRYLEKHGRSMCTPALAS